MEIQSTLRDVAANGYQRICDKALGVLVKAHERTGSNVSPNTALVRRVALDVVTAKTFLTFVDSKERLELLKSAGLAESEISTMIALHLVADYTGPVVIGTMLFLASQDLSNYESLAEIIGSLGACGLVGRAMYSLLMSGFREEGYKQLENLLYGDISLVCDSHATGR